MKRFKIELVFQVLDFLKFPKVVLFPCCWRVILGVLDRRTGSDALRLLCVTHSVCCVSPADPASDNANAMRPIVRLGTFVSHLWFFKRGVLVVGPLICWDWSNFVPWFHTFTNAKVMHQHLYCCWHFFMSFFVHWRTKGDLKLNRNQLPWLLNIQKGCSSFQSVGDIQFSGHVCCVERAWQWWSCPVGCEDWQEAQDELWPWEDDYRHADKQRWEHADHLLQRLQLHALQRWQAQPDEEVRDGTAGQFGLPLPHLWPCCTFGGGQVWTEYEHFWHSRLALGCDGGGNDMYKGWKVWSTLLQPRLWAGYLSQYTFWLLLVSFPQPG